jgi:TonB-linked SusC/RagA family outer membrane protein
MGLQTKFMHLTACRNLFLPIRVGRKQLLVMKLTSFLLLVACLNVSAGVYSQKVSLSGENIPLKQVFKEIKRQTGYMFVYREVLLKNATPVTLHVNNSNISQVLDLCLKDQPFTYAIIGSNIVVIKEKEGPPPPNKTQQEKAPPVKITGTVYSETGSPLANANIQEKGKTGGVNSRSDGFFEINVDNENAVLIISYVGYESKEIKVGGQTSLTIKLSPANTIMNDIVVIGYGTAKKATVTGAVEQVSSKTFESRAVTNPALALQGQTPGLVVTRSSSRPGNESINLQIRGATSVNGGSPLLVIDGVPSSIDKIVDGQLVATPDAFFTMNPDDIESVTILKDGMAAIYGARAANGVILVTTKRGKGKMKIDYNFNTRFNTMGIKTPSPGMEQYATMWIEANNEETVPDYWGWKSLENLQKMQQGIEGIYSTVYWGDIFIGQANRYDELFAARLSQQHTMSLSGSSDKTSYRLSAGYADNRGNLATAYDGQKQYNLRLNYDYRISDRVKLQTGVTYQKDNTSGPSGGLGFDMIVEDPPFFPAKNPYGQWYANFNTAGNRNSVASTTDGGRDIKTNDLIRVDMKGTVELLKGLELEGTASIQQNQYRWDNYNLTIPMYQWDGTLAPSSVNPTSNIRAESDNTFYQNYTGLVRYTKTFGDHRITAMAGLNSEKNMFKALYAYRTNIGSNGVYDLNAAPNTYVEGTGGRNHWGFYSYISRINYGYKDKYLLEVLGRRDGSSRFAPGYKWSNFYNVSAGWVVTNEEFLRQLRTPIDFMKIRASYGETGNQVGIGLYDYISQIGTGNAAFGTTPANQTAAWIGNSGLTSKTRTWERVQMMNMGIDLAFLNNRLTATFDYYKKKNDGMLINVTYPSALGGTAPKSNSGVLDVHGWEAILGWHHKIGEVSYNVSVNVSDSRNKLVSMEGATTWNAGKVGAIVGRPLNAWFMYETNGYYKDQAEVDGYYSKYASASQGELPSQFDQKVNLRPGDTKKLDLDGNGYISAIGDPSQGDKGDVKYMGDAAPHYIFGLNLGASWKGIDFAAFFQGVANQYVERDGTLAYPFWAVWTNSNTSFLGKTWTADRPAAKYPRLTVNNVRAQWNYRHNDFMLQNNRYLRMKSLIIGYTLPKSLAAKAKLERVRVYFSGNDLFEFTSIKDGFDPEQSLISQNNGYPFMRTWSFGVSLGL